MLRGISPSFVHISVLACLLSVSLSSAQSIRGLGQGEQNEPAAFTAIDDSAASALFVTTENIQSLNPDEVPALYRYEIGTAIMTRVVPYAVEWIPAARIISVSDDGNWVTFISRANPFGTNDDESPELFIVQSDGTNLSQVTSDPSPDSGSVLEARIAGSGNRVVFVSNADYGSNPQRIKQVFVIDREGMNLTQVSNATTTTPKVDVSISDDGTRIAFSHRADLLGTNSELNSELYAVNFDGTSLRQLTSAATGDSEWPEISGDGSIIAFHSSSILVTGDTDEVCEIFTILWDGTGLNWVASESSGVLPFPENAEFPSITDDGSTIYYLGKNIDFPSSDVTRVVPNVSSSTIYEPGDTIPGVMGPTVSGDGSKIIFFEWRYIGVFGFPLGNVTPQIVLIDSDGSNRTQITDGQWKATFPADNSPDGSTMLLDRTRSDAQQSDVWILDSDGTLMQVPGSEGGNALSIAADNSTILINRSGLRVMQRDGTGVVSLPIPATVGRMSDDASRVVIVSDTDVLGSNADGSDEVFVVNADGTSPVQLTNLASGDIGQAVIDASGSWIAFDSNSDLTGANPDGSAEIFRIRSDGSMLEQLTDDPVESASSPEISADGSRVIYVSGADPFGTNLDRSREIFMIEPATSTARQITDLSENIQFATLSGTGQWSFFSLASNIFEENPDGTFYAFRVNNDSGVLERIDGERTPPPTILNYWKSNPPRSSAVRSSRAWPDDTGDRVILERYPFANDRDLVGAVRRVDFTDVTFIKVSGNAPTVIDWIPVPGAVRYDVVRGDVSQIAFSGPDVDLGPVLCIEDDSPDSDTVGFEDLVDPISGKAFFYVFRSSAGLSAGPGSWGRAASGEERVAGAGNCN